MKIQIETKVITEIEIDGKWDRYTTNYLEGVEKMDIIISEIALLDAQEMADLDDIDKLEILTEESRTVTTSTEIVSVQCTPLYRVYNNSTFQTLTKGLHHECIQYISENYDENHKDFEHIFIESY